jgi:hypothetical protein
MEGESERTVSGRRNIFAREALDEIPKGIHAVTGYADTLVFYAQTKGISFQSSESTEEYITVIQAAIEATSHEHAAHGHFVQRLAWAYWARFEHSKQTEDLNRVMLYINGLLDAKKDIRPETEMVLAGAFHARFLGTKATQDIEGPFRFDTRYGYQYFDTSIQIPVFVLFRPVWQDPDTEQYFDFGGFRIISASLLSLNFQPYFFNFILTPYNYRALEPKYLFP